MSNDEGKFVTVAGHTRLQFGATEEAQQQPQQTAFRGEPGQNYNRQSHQELIRGMHGNGILGTATDAKLKPTTLVTYKGVQFPLSSAEQDGLVHRDANGVWREGPPPGYGAPVQQQQRAPELTTAERQQQEQQQAAVDAMKPEFVAPEVEAALSDAVKDVPEALLSSAYASLTAQLAEGKEVDLRRFASATGMNDERAAEYAYGYMHVLADQADKLFAAEGVDQDAFFQWARSERMSELKSALASHATTRSMSGYRDLIRRFKSRGF